MNSKLYGKSFKLNDNIINHLKQSFKKYGTKGIRGYNSVQNIINTKELSYENSKRIKNLLERLQNSEGNSKKSYLMLGGDKMLRYINDLLKDKRKAIESAKDLKQQAGMENSHIKSHKKDKTEDGSVNIPYVYEQKIILISETQYKKIITNGKLQ